MGNINDLNTERVQCPYCHEIIEVPNKVGEEVTCPKCRNKLVTYDKAAEMEQSAIARREKRKDFMWYGTASVFLIVIVAFIFWFKNRDEQKMRQEIRAEVKNEVYAKLAEKVRKGKSRSDILAEYGVMVQEDMGKWEKVGEWKDLSNGNGDKYILYKNKESEEMVIDFVIRGVTIQYPCKKYVVKSDKEFLCHEPSDTPGGGRGDFYLGKGSIIYVIQVGNGEQALDDNGYYDVTGLLVKIDEKRARIFMDNYAAIGRGYFMLNAALESY